MPTYTYKCRECENMFEIKQRFADDPLKDCPSCEEGTVRRVINSVGIVFKGDGFYVTDNRGKSSTAPSTAGETKSASKETASSESGSSDKKSSTKSESKEKKPKKKAKANA